MVLKVNDKIINIVPGSMTEFLKEHETLLTLANEFLSKEIISVDAKFSLYVGQGEYSVIPPNEDRIKIVGSDDATTCHIIILKHISGTVAVTHFDGGKNESEALSTIISEFINIDGTVGELEAYVIGGYHTPAEMQFVKKNESEKLSLKLLQLFKDQMCSIKIALWFTYKSNTKYINGESYPIFNGLAFNRETSEVFPATFQYQLPNYNLRFASHWVNCSQNVISVYNYKDKSVSIQPFFNWSQEKFMFYANISDQNILKYFSTSPSAEPPTFCNRLRNVFLLLGQNSTESLFPHNGPRIYTMNLNGEWEETS